MCVHESTTAHAYGAAEAGTNKKIQQKLLNKVIIFVFFAHKKYSRSFIKLRLNPWCHMDYFNDVLTTFVGLKCVSSLAVYMEGQKALGFHQKYLNLCSEDERRLYLFGTTWGWVINARMIIFGWDTLLTVYILVYWFMHFLQNAICLTLLCCVIFQF